MSVAVSVVVPVYNTEMFLRKCLDSLVQQTLENIEIIAVNDASPDNSLLILKEYREKYPTKFSYIDSPVNLRQGEARNLGIQAARGEFIAFVDSDDWVDTDMYRQLYAKALETGCDIVDSDYFIVKNDQLFPCGSNTSDQLGELNVPKRKSLVMNTGRMWTKIYRRSLWVDYEITYPEHTFYEDNEISSLPLMYANHLEKVESCLYHYFIRENSTSHNINTIYDRFQTSENVIHHYKNRNLYDIYKDEVDIRFLQLYYGTTLNIFILHYKKGFPLKEMNRMRKTVKQLTPDYKTNPYYQQIPLRHRVFMSINNIHPLLLLPLKYGYHFIKFIYWKPLKKEVIR